MAVDSAALIDVILPARNVGPWLADCLRSLRAQSFRRWRAIVVLDGCTDATESIARDFARRDSRIEVHEGPGLGVGAARNWGFAHGDAPFVAFLDADDIVPSGALESLLDSLSSSGSQLATGRATEFYPDGREHPYWTAHSGRAPAVRGTTLAVEPGLVLDHTCWNKLYSRAFLSEQSLTFADEAVIAEDALHTISAIVAASAIDVVDATVYRHRVREGSLTSGLRSPEAIRDWVVLTTRVVELLTESAPRAARELYAQRMLEAEAFTRLRQLPAIASDQLVIDLIALIRSVAALLPDATLSALPTLQRLSYSALGVGDALSGPVPTQKAARLAEFELVEPGEEFAPLSAAWHSSGTELHARIWRECLLGPVQRVHDVLDAAQRANAAGIVLAFAERFVASHLLSPAEQQSLAVLSGGTDETERRIGAELVEARATRRALALRGTVGGIDTDSARLVASSRGRIAGIRLSLGRMPLTRGAFAVTVHEADLRPHGRWSLSVEAGEASAPLRLAVPVLSRANPRTRRIWSLSRVGEPVTVETRDSLPRRLSRAAETWVRAGASRVAPRVLYRVAGRARRLVRTASTRSRNASDITRGG